MPKDMVTHCLGWELYVWETKHIFYVCSAKEGGMAKWGHSVSISVTKGRKSRAGTGRENTGNKRILHGIMQ